MAVIYRGKRRADGWIRIWNWGKLYVNLTRPIQYKHRTHNMCSFENRLLGQKKWVLKVAKWILHIEFNPYWR